MNNKEIINHLEYIIQYIRRPIEEAFNFEIYKNENRWFENRVAIADIEKYTKYVEENVISILEKLDCIDVGELECKWAMCQRSLERLASYHVSKDRLNYSATDAFIWYNNIKCFKDYTVKSLKLE